MAGHHIGKPTDHPALQLIDRTMANLEHFKNPVDKMPSYQVTQWINSLTGVLILAHEKLLDPGKLSRLERSSPEAKEFGFDVLEFALRDAGLRDSLRSIKDVLRFFRHGFAHGNVQVGPGFWMLGKEHEIINVLVSNDFVGIVIWRGRSIEDPSQGPVALHGDTLLGFLRALSNLAHDRWFWSEEALSWNPDPDDVMHPFLRDV